MAGHAICRQYVRLALSVRRRAGVEVGGGAGADKTTQAGADDAWLTSRLVKHR